MNKQSFITILLTVLMSMTGAKTFAHDIEAKNADNVTIYYKWINNNTELAVSYRGSSFNNGVYTGNVVIPKSVVYEGNTYSVTSIGDYAFYYSSGLTSVTIPNSVTSIGKNALSACSGLTSVTIPNSVTSIGDNALSGCNGLTSITIPNSVTSIGQFAFSTCNSLTKIVSEIKIPFEIGNIAENSVTLIVPVGTKAAYQSTAGWGGFTRIVEVGEGGLVGSQFEIDGINYTIGENNTAVLTSRKKAISGAFVIPNQVDFNGKKYNVTSIGSGIFSGCSGLTSITIPSNVNSINSNAFYGCSGLTSVTIPNSVTSISSYAFQNCSGLTSVIIGSGMLSIGYNAFSNTNLKKTIWLTNTPPSGYGNASGAVNYVSNAKFYFENMVVYKSLSSYFEVDGVRYVPVNLSERTCDAIDCVYDESSANTKIASTVTYKGIQMTVMNIKPYLAYNNKYINTLSLDIAGGLPDNAFTGCSNLKTVTYSDKINGIGNYSFSDCSSLISLTSTEDVSYSNVLYISKNINTIGDYAFNGCKEINNVIIADGESTLTLGSYGSNPIFSSCPLDYVYIGRDISYQTSSSYGYSPFYRNTSLRAMKITDKETEISDNEFYGCTNLQNVTIGDGVTTIGKWAFSGCSSLKFFAFGSQMATIGQEAFSDCTALVEITSKAQAAPACGSQALEDINKWECKLFIPDGCTAVYEAADQWKDFLFKDEGEGTASQGESGEQIVNKCETPTISLVGDKLSFACATEGVVYHYTISHSDVQNGASSKDVDLTQTYTITVFARKDGYGDSEVARATIKVSGSGLTGDVDGNGVVNVADHVKLSDIIMNK